MGKAVAVEGCQLSFSSGTGNISVTSVGSQVFKCGGKSVYKGTIDFSVSGYLGGAVTDGNGVGTGSIVGSATMVKTEGGPVVLLGDNVQVSISGTASGNPASTVDVVTVTDAGQSVVKAV